MLVTLYTPPACTDHQPSVQVFHETSFTQGTGSLFELKNIRRWKDQVEHRLSICIDLPDNVELKDIRAPIEHLENIRQTLKLSISELARLFSVSRQAVHKWLTEKSEPDADKQKTLMTLSQIADAFQEASISRGDLLLKMKAFDGRSLLDLIQAGQYQSDHLDVLIHEAKAMKAARQRSGLDTSKAKPTDDWRSYISIPGTFETESKG